ncbi:MAG: META domain-containing protein [Bacteroidota bacterium]
MFFLSLNAQIKFKGITWVLTKIEGNIENSSLIIDHNYTILRFDDSTYVGYGCNAFSGKYKITGNKINFISGMLNTDQGCTDREDYKAEDYDAEFYAVRIHAIWRFAYFKKRRARYIYLH